MGTYIHLWYLPFAFLAGIGSVSLRQSLTSMPTRGGSLGIALAGTALLAFSASVVGSVSPIAPIPQWIYAAPSILFGLAIGVIVQQSERRHQVALFAGVIGVLWLTCIGLWLQGVRAAVPQYALGLPLVCCAYLWTARGHPTLKAWGDLSFGIYLIHPLLSSLLERALLTPFDVEMPPIPRILLVYGLSLAATYGIRETPIRRFCQRGSSARQTTKRLGATTVALSELPAVGWTASLVVYDSKALPMHSYRRLTSVRRSRSLVTSPNKQ